MSIDSMLSVITMFREENYSLPLRYIEAFLLVAEEEGLAIADYAKKLGTSQSVTARCFDDMGEQSREGHTALGWVRREPVEPERRTNRILLTPKGKEMRERVRYA